MRPKNGNSKFRIRNHYIKDHFVKPQKQSDARIGIILVRICEKTNMNVRENPHFNVTFAGFQRCKYTNIPE